MTSVPIQLISLDLRAVDEALGGGEWVAGHPVTPGALPPPFLLEAARAALTEGRPALWYAPFLFESDGRIVGSGGFKGPPQAGEVEIGYGVAPAEEGRGFATEAVRLFCARAAECPEVEQVTAETAIGNVASQRVLEKAGFEMVGTRNTAEDGPVFRWCRRVLRD